ncbi:MAG: thermonuclease family protein [Kiloniellales bacterium]
MLRSRWWRFVGVLTILALLGLPGQAASSLEASDPRQARVIDGDSLQIDGTVIELFGIDAPELGQLCYRGTKPWPCGLEAAYALHKLLALAQTPLRCTPVEGAADGSMVCELGDQVLAEVLVRQGHAVALADGVAEYREAETAAKQARLGVWGGDFVMPARWRAGERLARNGGETDRCNIKGVVRDGRRLYYVPLDPGYESLRLDLVRGDQVFCSDEQARRLGWRREGEMAPSQ